MRNTWKILGIPKTTDRAAIRSAYAARLREIDPDTDPERFMVLRAARDTALRLAAPSAAAAIGPIGSGHDVPADPAEHVSARSEALPSAANARSNESEHIRAFALERLEALLFPAADDAPPLTGEQEAELEHTLALLLADRGLEDVRFYSGAEAWFAERIAQSIPRSDPLIDPASRFFGWGEKDHVNQNPAITYILDRLKALRFRDEARQYGHRFHKAWTELTTPATETSRRGWVSSRRVDELLTLVRTRHPSLEGHFDGYRVSLWETRWSSLRNGCGTTFVLAFVLLQVVRCVSTVSEPGSPSVASDPAPFVAELGNAAEDIDLALAGLNLFTSDFNAASIAGKNPALHASLMAEWHRSRAADANENEFARTLALLLDRLYATAMSRADHSLLRGNAAVKAAQAAAARRLGWEQCDNFFTGVGLPPRSQEIDAQRRTHIVTALFSLAEPLDAAPGSMHRRERMFVISGEILGAVMKSSGLSEQNLRNALSGKGSAEERCRARQALLTIALDLPEREAMTLLPSI